MSVAAPLFAGLLCVLIPLISFFQFPELPGLHFNVIIHLFCYK